MRNSHSNELRACSAYADLLVDLSDDELPDNDRRGVEEHLASCEACRAELHRLNTSLLRLRAEGVGSLFRPDRNPTASALAEKDSRPRSRSGVRWLAVSTLAAAIACLVGGAWGVWRLALPNRPPEVVRNHETEHQPPPLSQEEALRRIALIEQQARLQASLELMPNDPWFASQRATNEQLLIKFKEAAEAPRAAGHNGDSL